MKKKKRKKYIFVVPSRQSPEKRPARMGVHVGAAEGLLSLNAIHVRCIFGTTTNNVLEFF